jgi:2-dehydropantoate 2-reductase
MQKIERVLIAGAGAVGLIAVEAVYRYDPRALAVLAGGERLRRYRETGLWVNGERLDFEFADPGADRPSPIDLIIVACKNHQLPGLINDLARFVGEETLILSLLNGISSEELIGAACGGWRLPLAMIIGTDSQNTGRGAAFSQRGIINFGDGEGKDTRRDRLIAEFLGRAGLPFEHHPAGMRRVQWFKFMLNAGLNQVSALLMLPYGPFKRDSPRRIREVLELTESAMGEVISVANAEGIDLGAEDIEKVHQSLVKLNDRGFTSMCQDLRARKKTEVELFGLTVMEYGKKHRIPTPVNEVLYRAIRGLEQSYYNNV